MGNSDCEFDGSEKDKTAEKEVLSTSFIKTTHTLLKDADDQIDNLKEDKESSKKQEPEVKLKKSCNKDEREKSKDESVKNKDEMQKSKDESARHADESPKNKDEALMDHADNIMSVISSVVPATTQVTINDKVSLSNAEKNEVLEKKLPDDVTMQEVEISKANEMIEETLKDIKESMRKRKKKKHGGRSAARNDAATVTNDENGLPHPGREESQDVTLSDALLVVDCSRDDIMTDIDRKTEIQNEKLDGEQRKRRKKKTKRSAMNGEGGRSTEIYDPHLNENAKEHETILLDAARKDGDDEVTKAKRSKKSLVSGPEDLPSKCQSTELESEPEKSQSTDHQTSKNMTVSEVKSKAIVNDEGNISKEGFQDMDSLGYLNPRKDTTTSVKVKKPKKKTNEQLLVDSRNDDVVQPQKLILESENKKVSTHVVSDPNISNTDQFKTPKKKSKIDAPRISESAHANKAHGEPSAEVFLNQKSDRPRVTLGLASVKAVQKSPPEVNKSQQHSLSGSGTMSGGDSDKRSADDNASPGRSSSAGDIMSSIYSRTNGSGSSAVKRKEGGGTQSKSRNISMTGRVRSSPRFKRTKVTASQQPGDTDCESVEFVPNTPPPMA